MSSEQTPKLILISNDDGIDAEGLKNLAQAASSLGEIVVIAPNREQSASSHALTLWHPLRLIQHDANRYSSDGSPADCINLGIHWVLRDRRPDLVLSGINHGANLGEDLFYSGTVSAAREAAILGIPAIAISCCGRKNFHFETASHWAFLIAKALLTHGVAPGIFLNVNVPNLPLSEIAGLEITRQGHRTYGAGVIEKHDPRGRSYYWISGTEPLYTNEPETDSFAIREKKVSITPIHLDTTHYPSRQDLAHWKF